MAELITPEQPRIKFGLRRVGTHEVAEARASRELRALCELMLQMEAAGAAPVLNDGKVGGNCALDEDLALDMGPQASRPVGPEVQAAATGCRASASGTGDSHAAAILVSRSGKAPGAALAAEDFARVCAFDRAAWAADYQSPSEALRPSADTPLLWACLAPGAREAYGWTARPRVAFHGHALESGAGLLAARRRGIPVSERETLFSTREDLGELEALFKAHPYPQHRVYVRCAQHACGTTC
ncbi:hypothetical protein MNEG_12989 [Monoraphidium neglectum]|uniref:Uncharacterized protein n=1 Tax=Monoraphidium neglectum TaxID=145388 RepID=A0A0D2J4W6_9CHLO|nr:hypothetical protein MNEG_12989 [Monoraphidium neglectum]KIY94972.1 hypothetical protein MNEG_12989 [Monoraphidium neglectum]|eukprot:XP_013893992.1 hypothetical protein MNEG_12989 [Monoraphidium neglectum]